MRRRLRTLSEVDGTSPLDERFEQIDARLGRMDERFERKFDQINQRFNQLDQRRDDQSSQFNERIDRLHEQMRVMMRGTVGTIALFGTIVTVLLAIAQFGG